MPIYTLEGQPLNGVPSDLEILDSFPVLSADQNIQVTQSEIKEIREPMFESRINPHHLGARKAVFTIQVEESETLNHTGENALINANTKFRVLSVKFDRKQIVLENSQQEKNQFEFTFTQERPWWSTWISADAKAHRTDSGVDTSLALYHAHALANPRSVSAGIFDRHPIFARFPRALPCDANAQSKSLADELDAPRRSSTNSG